MKQLIFILTLFAVSACGSKESNPAPEPTLNSTEVKLNYDKTFDFTVNNASASSWESSNMTTGVISSDGKFTAKRVGETTITTNVGGKKLTAKVIVEPYAMFVEPIVKPGLTKEEIKAFEKHELLDEYANSLVYIGDNAKGIINYSYGFQSSIGFFGVTYNMKKEEPYYTYLATYFKERYDEIKQGDPSVYQFKIKDRVIAELNLTAGYFAFRIID